MAKLANTIIVDYFQQMP